MMMKPPPEMDQVILIASLRKADNEPLGIQLTFLPVMPDQTITPKGLSEFGSSLDTLLEIKFDLISIEADETLEAIIASERVACPLEVEECSPLFLRKRITFSQHKRPMDFVKDYHLCTLQK